MRCVLQVVDAVRMESVVHNKTGKDTKKNPTRGQTGRIFWYDEYWLYLFPDYPDGRMAIGCHYVDSGLQIGHIESDHAVNAYLRGQFVTGKIED